MATAKLPVVLAVLAFAGALTSARADEVVHFTNGAEMTVRSHTVNGGTVRLDLGDNSFIAFPMAMVEKIDGAGPGGSFDPGFHPSNQAVAEGAGGGPVMNAKYAGSQQAGDAPMSAVGKASPGWAAPSTAAGTVAAPSGNVATALPVNPPGDPRVVEQANDRYQRYLNPGGAAPAFGGHPVMMPPRPSLGKPRQLMAVPMAPTAPTPAPNTGSASTDSQENQ